MTTAAGRGSATEEYEPRGSSLNAVGISELDGPSLQRIPPTPDPRLPRLRIAVLRPRWCPPDVDSGAGQFYKK